MRSSPWLRTRVSLCSLALAVVACSSEPEVVGTTSRSLVGGVHDAGYGSVALLVYGNGEMCTAVLVHERFALTSADCVDGEIVADMRLLFMGPQNRADLPLLRGHVARATVDPGWDHATGHAIAVLELTEAVPETVARPQAIAAAGLDASLVGQSVTAVAAGYDGPPGAGIAMAGYRTSVTSTVVSLADDSFVWGDVAHDTCFGDTGGPVLQLVDGRDTVIGLIVSGTSGCGQPVAARLDVQRDFIIATTAGALVPGTGALTADAGFGPPDAAPAAPDAAAAPDAGTSAASDDGGCGCQVGRSGSPRTRPLPLLAALTCLGLVLGGRSLRRRRAARGGC